MTGQDDVVAVTRVVKKIRHTRLSQIGVSVSIEEIQRN